METARLPRESLLWIFAAQFVVLLPHFTRLPIWIVLGWVVAVLWRFEVFRGRRELPGKVAKLIAVIIAIGGLSLSYHRWFALEPMVALLAVAFSLKNLELVTRRDAFLNLILAYFVAGTLLVFEQTIPYALYGLTAVGVVTAALAAQQGGASAQPARALRMVTKLFLQALPLMVLLFVVIPRMGPLWAVPQNSGAATTGMSDTMKPGSFGKLSQSDKPALRISFDGPIPPPEQRYWRGLVFSNFNNGEWRQGIGVDPRDGGRVIWQNSQVPLPEVGPRYRYQVIQEATQQPWLFALASPYSETRSVGETLDDRLVKRTPVFNRFAYQVQSWPRESFNAARELREFERRRNLQLPTQGNPRTRDWVRSLQQNHSSAEAISTAVLNHFNRTFTYTLEPPTLFGDTVDGFLFDTQQGFCEHFASSYVFAMRAAGVPARVVAGYQGGEWVEGQQYLLVREYDAHAWAEIWIEGRGWQRVDPTAAVAPERVRSGLQTAVADEFMQDALLPLHKSSFLNELRLQWDMINYRWYQTVVSFDAERQQSLLRKLIGEVDAMRLALFLALPVVLALLSLWGWMLWSGRGRKLPPAARLYLRFCRRLERVGLVRERGEAPRDFAERVAAERPKLGPVARHFTAAYEQAAYADNPTAVRQMRRLLRGFWPVSLMG